jgi:hypothetical protein
MRDTFDPYSRGRQRVTQEMYIPVHRAVRVEAGVLRHRSVDQRIVTRSYR